MFLFLPAVRTVTNDLNLIYFFVFVFIYLYCKVSFIPQFIFLFFLFLFINSCLKCHLVLFVVLTFFIIN